MSKADQITDEGGSVDVRIDKIAEVDDLVTLKFSVKDTGIGISPEQKDKIFDEFFSKQMLVQVEDLEVLDLDLQFLVNLYLLWVVS